MRPPKKSSNKAPYQLSRRNFLGNTLGSMAYLAALGSPAGLIRRAMAQASPNSTANKRYLVNIQGMGGWDMHWFHSTFPASHAAFPTPSTATGYADFETINQSNGLTNGITENYFHQRYPDSQLLQHPNRSDVQMGMGMKYVFNSAPDLIANDIAIWKGITKDFDHQVGNKIFQHGGLSSYALSFSALVAQGIAQTDYQRPLHYVQLTDTPDDFNSNWSNNRGAAVPVNIQDYNSFNGLTSPNTNDFSVTSQRDMVNSAVSQLANLSAGRFSLKASQQAYTSFLSSFTAAAQLGSTNVAQSVRFKYLWRTYSDAMFSMVYGMFDASFQANLLPLQGADGTVYAAVNLAATGAQSQMNAIKSGGYDWTQPSPFKSYADALAQESTAAASPWLSSFYNIARGGLATYPAMIIGAAFNYAMAEFMIREDLAAVIDVPTPTSDAHDLTDDHILRLVSTFTAYRTLLSNLKSTGHLGYTTVAMWSELDRTPNWMVNTNVSRRGTGHNQTTSALLAGYGVAGGKVIGDVMSGPGGPYGWSLSGGTWTHNFQNVGYSTPLPIDSNSGLVSTSANAVIASTKCMLPTMLAIFGIPVPGEQITDGIDLPCLRKS